MENVVGGTQKKSPIELSLKELDNQIEGCKDRCNTLNERLQSILVSEKEAETTKGQPVSGDSTLEQGINIMRETMEDITVNLTSILDRLQI